MSEESVQQAEGREVPGEVTQTNRHEESASQHGWVPLEVWEEEGKDPDDWVDAKTFNMRGEFFDKIHKQKREIDDMRKAMQDLKRMQAQTAEIERNKVLKQLREAKKAAIENMDGDAVIEIDERIDEVKQYQIPDVDRQEMQRAEQEAQQLFIDWKAQNPWYDTDQELAEYADFQGMKMQAAGKSPEEIFTAVSEKVKKQFPNKFENPRRSQSAVAPSTGQKTATRGTKHNWNNLSEEQKQAGNRFVRLGVFETKEEYMKELAKSGAI